MNAQEILNAAFVVLMQDHWAPVSLTAFVWDDEEAEHWLMQIAMGQTLGVYVNQSDYTASPCLV